MATWLFRTPTLEEGPAGLDPLFHRVKLTRGISIQELPQGTFRALRFPTQDEIAESFFFYLGGHEYVVTDDQRTALINGGVGVTAANFSYAPGTYGAGPYGAGPYGG